MEASFFQRLKWLFWKQIYRRIWIFGKPLFIHAFESRNPMQGKSKDQAVLGKEWWKTVKYCLNLASKILPLLARGSQHATMINNRGPQNYPNIVLKRNYRSFYFITRRICLSSRLSNEASSRQARWSYCARRFSDIWRIEFNRDMALLFFTFADREIYWQCFVCKSSFFVHQSTRFIIIFTVDLHFLYSSVHRERTNSIDTF